MADTTITDPLGRRISLHDRTWFGHIVPGHPELADLRELVARAVQAPLEIRYSRSDPDGRLFYGPGPRQGVIMMVVVDVGLGLVKTAHLARSVSGGTVEWPTTSTR